MMSYRKRKQDFDPGIQPLIIFVTLNSILTNAFHDKDKLCCASIDTKKAFNSIVRQGLWYKINSLGMNGKLLRVIKCMYSKIKCCIRGRKCTTYFFHNFTWSTTRSHTITIFICIFLNDLPDLLKTHNSPGGINIDETDIMMLMYADDIVLVSKYTRTLQNSLHLLYDYRNTWKLF